MASFLIPSTPASQASQSSPALLPPGTWRHPRFDEITRRQSQAVFTDRNFKRILWNGGMLLGTWGVSWALGETPKYLAALRPLPEYAAYPLLLFRILLVLNTIIAMLPLIRPKDDLVDIPLTPSQRALLGLDPNSPTQATPASEYSTPPRYPRSSTPRSGFSGRSSSYSASPLSGKGSPLLGRSQGEPAYSPTISSLLQKAIDGSSRDTMRRRSFGLTSSVGSGTDLMENSTISLPSTPTPSSGRGATIGLNSKWLYERGRGSPLTSSVYS